MTDPEFVAYVGHADFHDGHIRAVCHAGDQVDVVVEGYSGRKYKVHFSGVRRFMANQPEGMMIYALNEMRATPPFRCFLFTNWDEDDPASLEIEAREFTIE